MGVYAYPDTQLTRSELDFNSADNAPIKQLARFKTNGLLETKYAPPASVSMDQAIPVQVVSKPNVPVGSDVKMTLLTIVTRQNKFEALKEAMNEIGVTGMTVTQVLGFGIQKGSTEYYRGAPMEVNLLPKVQVDIVVAKVPVRTVIETAKKVLYTGKVGDGKIFIYDVENVVRVRTGEEGYDALQDED